MEGQVNRVFKGCVVACVRGGWAPEGAGDFRFGFSAMVWCDGRVG